MTTFSGGFLIERTILSFPLSIGDTSFKFSSTVLPVQVNNFHLLVFLLKVILKI